VASMVSGMFFILFRAVQRGCSPRAVADMRPDMAHLFGNRYDVWRLRNMPATHGPFALTLFLVLGSSHRTLSRILTKALCAAPSVARSRSSESLLEFGSVIAARSQWLVVPIS